MKVQDVMTTKVESVLPTTSLRNAARKMADLGVGSMAVVRGERLLGIITDRDISVYAIAMGHDPNSTEVQKVMTSEVYTCADNQDISEAAKIMEEHHIRRLAVTNRGNGMAGILSVDDLAHVSHELAGAVLEAAIPTH